jgi:3-oxoacyl-[acyl-carrier-protein] synthase II
LKRVVVTGLGMINALGHDKDSFTAMVKGECGIDTITLCDTRELDCKIAAEVKGFDPSTVLKKRDQKKADRFIQLGLHAAMEAYADAALTDVDTTAFGVVSANCLVGIGSVEEAADIKNSSKLSHISPFLMPSYMPNMLAGQVSMKFDLRGPNLSENTACAAGTHAIIEAYKTLQFSKGEGMLVVGAEAGITPLAIGGFGAMNALCKDHNETPKEAVRPFDKARSGFVMGEGAGALVLETLEHAQKRGAKIYAEIIGFGESADAYHISTPHPESRGAISAMRDAFEMALSPKVDYINAHGTSTFYNDICEAKAIAEVFGDMRPYVSSIKGQIGHTLGAAGAIEAVVSILAMQKNILPPIINYSESEDEMEKINLVKNSAVQTEVNCVLSCNFGFGGTNAAIVFKQFIG